jgi:predicted nucleic acid-binding protein
MKRELFVDTGLLAAYLLHAGAQPSLLERLAMEATLFTSVLNATELLGAVTSDDERFQVESVLGGLHVLGFHQRYARRFGALAKGRTDAAHLRDCMIAGCCLESGLALVTGDAKRYEAFPHLMVISETELEAGCEWTRVESLISGREHGAAGTGR